jgi:hypothetical protein
MLLVNVSEKHDIPGEPGQWLNLRKLSWSQLAEAREAQESRMMERLQSLGAGMMTALRASETPEFEEAKEAASTENGTYDLASYDLLTVLEAGIESWSYDGPVTTKSLKALDAKTAEWAGQQILKGSQPPDASAEKNF